MDSLFNPSSIAVVGASATTGKIGNTIVRNLIDAGFKGEIYPVNPNGSSVCNLKAYKSVLEIGSVVDMAVIALPGTLVASCLSELAAQGVKAVVVISAGFKEVGHEGWNMEQELIRIAKENNICLLGPNCLGFINASDGVNASFIQGNPPAGNIAFFSQSGALCIALMDWAMSRGIGFSKFISLGNKAVIDEAALLKFLSNDPETRVILGYIENIENGREFMEQARRLSIKKPIIMLKSGNTCAGARAASSHTGAIAGSERAYDAAFKQAGIIRVSRLEDMLNLSKAFSLQSAPKGSNLAIITNAGGPGILAADACSDSGLRMARLSLSTIGELHRLLPGYASLYNPVDILGDADSERYKVVSKLVLQDPMVHAVLVIISTVRGLDPAEAARAVVEAVANSGKPVFCCIMGRSNTGEARDILDAAGIPVYDFPKPAVRAMESLHSYSLWKGYPPRESEEPERDIDCAAQVINRSIRTGHSEIVGFQAREILKAYGLAAPLSDLARCGDDAVAIAEDIGFPVVLKIASPNISHKSDVDGVVVDLNTPEEVQAAFWDITARAQRLRPDAYIVGCLVQQMAPSGSREIIAGFKRDEQFGPLIMFGLGGVHVEILQDVSFRLAPLAREDASAMIREIKSYMLLKGLRGGDPVNFDAITDVLLKISCLAMDFPDVCEAEFNPVLVGPDSALVADVRMTVRVGSYPEYQVELDEDSISKEA